MPLSEELGHGSELRLLRLGPHRLQRWKLRLISVAAGGDGAGLFTRSGRAVELLVGGAKGCRAESALVDQMELLKGVVADQGLRLFPRSD